PASSRVKLHFKWAMPRLRVKSLYGPVLPFFTRAARLSGAVGDRFAAGRALRRNAAHRRSCAVISAHRGCPRPCEFAGRAADFPSTGSYAPLLARTRNRNAIDRLLGHDVRCWKRCNKGRYRQHRAQSQGPTLLKLHRPFSGILLRFADKPSKWMAFGPPTTGEVKPVRVREIRQHGIATTYSV